MTVSLAFCVSFKPTNQEEHIVILKFFDCKGNVVNLYLCSGVCIASGIKSVVAMRKNACASRGAKYDASASCLTVCPTMAVQKRAHSSYVHCMTSTPLNILSSETGLQYIENCFSRIRLCIAITVLADRSTYVSSQSPSVLFIRNDSSVKPNANGLRAEI